MAEPLKVVIDDNIETVIVDPDTGTVQEFQPDGGVVVRLDAHKPKDEDAEDEWFGNLAADIEPLKLSGLAMDLYEAVSADNTSREGYLQTKARGMDLLGIKLEQPKGDVGESASGVEGMSSVTNPLLLDAVLHGWANAQAELLPSAGPMKISDEGDETATEDQLAETLERDFNFYLTKVATEYYPDTSHMLLWGVYFGGSGFKKVYRCPLRRRPVSESVDAKQLIVSDTTKDLRSCGRITHEIPMRQSVMKRMKMIGAYRDTANNQPPQDSPNAIDSKIASIQNTQAQAERPEDRPYIIWEIQCELDLPEFAPGKFEGEGIPLPYLVTLDKESKEILAIRRDWEEDDEECERKRMYVRYPYVPGPGFYGTGMLNILGNASAALTAAWREALDAGMFANFPAGLIAKLGGRQNSSSFRLGPGEFEAVETNGMPISQIVTGLPYKDVTPGLLALIDKIQAQAKALGGSADIPSAEGIQNVPVGTMMAQIEQATKVIAAAHKGMHQAQSEEFTLLVDLFREHPEDFWRWNKKAKTYWNEEKLLEALDNVSLVPVSDPNVPSHIHRVAKALALVQLTSLPQFASRLNPDEALSRILAAIREDPRGLQIQAPPTPPDPMAAAKEKEAAAKVAKIEADAAIAGKKQQTEAMKVNADATEAAGKQQLDKSELETQRDLKTLDITKELIIHQADDRKAGIAEERNQILEHKAHDLGERQQAHDHALDIHKAGVEATTAQHDRNLGLAQHALDTKKAAVDAAVKVHQAVSPPQPKPAASGKPKAKTPKAK